MFLPSPHHLTPAVSVSTQSKLSNESFVQRAPVEVVAQQRETQADLVSQVKLLAENMVSLKQGT